LHNGKIFLADSKQRAQLIGLSTEQLSASTWDTYYYEKNLQGDFVSVYDATGTKLVSYTYNAWGRNVYNRFE
jgi:two-component sensor histidine kinase